MPSFRFCCCASLNPSLIPLTLSEPPVRRTLRLLFCIWPNSFPSETNKPTLFKSSHSPHRRTSLVGADCGVVPSLQGLPSVAAAPVMSGPLMPVRTVQRRPMRPGQVRALPASFDVTCLAAAALPHRPASSQAIPRSSQRKDASSRAVCCEQRTTKRLKFLRGVVASRAGPHSKPNV